MRLVPLTATLALLLLAPRIDVPAQSPAGVSVGQRVRISTHDRERLVGELRAVSADTLVVAVPATRASGAIQVTVPPTQVRGLEVSRTGPRQSGAGTGLVVGLAAGAVFGYVIGNRVICGGCDHPGTIGVMFFTPIGAITGLVIGATTGRERWTSVEWPPRASGGR